MSFKEVKLPSGATLKIFPAPFAEAKALYQAVLEDSRYIPLTQKNEVSNMMKDFFCINFSSKKVEKCLEACLALSTYNGGQGDVKINKDTFEPVEAREDYVSVCMEVAKENIAPFVKSLYAEFVRLTAIIESSQA